MTTVSVITPWLNARVLIPVYEQSVKDANQVIVIDNGSVWHVGRKLLSMCEAHRNGVYIHNKTNQGFSTANNQGIVEATGDILLFVNNDVELRKGFFERLIEDVQPGALYGPSRMHKHGYDYLEGWCIAGRREVWDALEGWDDQYYTGLYWEDNDLCFRAFQAGYKIIQAAWPVWHYGNYTTRLMYDEATAHSEANERLFLERVRQSCHS